MDITTIIIVSLIVSAFLLFAGVLAYADYATRQARRAQASKAEQEKPHTASAIVEHRDAA